MGVPAGGDDDRDAIRSLVRYGPDGPEILERSDHVEGSEDAVDLFRTVTAQRFQTAPYGPHAGSVHAFGDVDVVHVPQTADHGLVATVEGTSRARTIHDLVDLVERIALETVGEAEGSDS